jgi:hypothetical protein
MADQAMRPLRRRMIEDMTIRKLAPKTQQGYIRTIRDFCCVPRPIARHGELRGRPALSTASTLGRGLNRETQRNKTSPSRNRMRYCQELRYAFAVFRSAVSKPSLKRSYTDCRRLRASAMRP